MKQLSALLIALLLLVSLPLTAFAAGAVDMERSVSLTISYTYEDTKLQDVEFKLYLISTMDECGELIPVPEFAAYEGMLDIRGENDDAWFAATDALNNVIHDSDTLQPTASAVTDAQGFADFGKDLAKGLYLVTRTTHSHDGYVYSSKPFMVLLPGRDRITDEWIYDVAVSPKKEKNPVLADYTVKKEWVDYGEEKNRPDSITIHLYGDDVLFDTIRLPHNGNWSYTWEDLDTNKDWSVREDKVNGYKTPEITQEGTIFYVKNTLDKPKLPQTGQLNWPIPLMAVAGLAFFVVGWALCSSKKRERYEK